MTQIAARPGLAKDRVIARLREAEQALQVAITIQQKKVVLDFATVQEVFARRQKLGEDVIGYAHSIKIHALAQLGALIEAAPKATGTRGQLAGGSRKIPPAVAPSLADLGINKKIADIARVLAALSEADQEAIAARTKTVAAAKRERTHAAIRRKIQLPDAKYRVVYADPPWHYSDVADAGSVQAGGAARHYPTMSIAELCALPIAPIVEEHAVLFLWVTVPLLYDAAPIPAAWGFKYKTHFVWDKVRHNMGHYNSVRHELLLVCTRGSCTPDASGLRDSVQVIERTEHSVKPAAFRDLIDALYPLGKRIELFAREAVPGWDTYGYEAEASA